MITLIGKMKSSLYNPFSGFNLTYSNSNRKHCNFRLSQFLSYHKVDDLFKYDSLNARNLKGGRKGNVILSCCLIQESWDACITQFIPDFQSLYRTFPLFCMSHFFAINIFPKMMM